jgi:hypothetical protein
VKLDELRELREAATPGPWRVDDDWSDYGGAERGWDGAGWVTPHGAYSNNRADNELMALAPDLARLVERLVDVLQVMDDEGAFSVLANGALYRQMFTNTLASLAELGEEGG